ncbi:MAG: sigma-70 family RNA polymerase sigma factor [Clostridiales bacterium]|nr:sigma-70 family RNA polymerase sigma factor [Clostridiales bacterium]
MDAAKMHALACEYAHSPSEETLRAALEEALPLCALIARRFSGRGIDYEDLYQVASMACVSALKNFDAKRGLKFTTFVTPTITGTVRNYLRDKAQVLRTPRGIKEQGAQLSAAREKFLQENRREPSPRELAEALNWDVSRVLTVLSAQDASQVSSLDQQDEEGLAMGDRIPFVETGFEQAELRQDLKKALATLSTQEQQLLILRFQRQMSQREAAQELGMTQMQVSRMERRVLLALRKEMDTPQ